MVPVASRSSPESTPTLCVRAPDGGETRHRTPFTIGRSERATVRVEHEGVSRVHVDVSFVAGQWVVSDHGSTFGLMVDGTAVATASVGDRLTVQLGAGGPFFTFELETPPTELPCDPVEAPPDEGSQPNRISHLVMIAIGAVLLLGAGAYSYGVHRQLARQQQFAENIFYRMKALDVSIANLERSLAQSSSSGTRQQINDIITQRRELQSDYDQQRKEHESAFSEKDRLILRVTQIFGECELAAPSEYFDEVNRYIGFWLATGRYADAIKKAGEKGYTKTIRDTLVSYDLPPHYFYLALRESEFDPFASGRRTRVGIAKGMWQFVPPTAKAYGLAVGPLAEFQRPDLDDDRHDWVKSTHAAARYIKDIYATDAQASGLLVMASYNWGEQRVLRLLQSIPRNPRERNFWQVLKKYRDQLPQETYDYVFHIVAAAVIGENPRLFGFQFDSPLATADVRTLSP